MGTSFFYFGGESPMAVTKNDWTQLPLIYSKKSKRKLDYSNEKNEIFIIDDSEIISQHIAFYVTKTQGDTNYIQHYKHTEKPFMFWGFIDSEYDSQMNTAPESTLMQLAHILVLTTPKWGIYVKYSREFFNAIKGTQSKIRIEYLNYTSSILNTEAINKLIGHLTDKVGLVTDPNNMDIIAAVPPENVGRIREKVQIGTRFNGIIRSITDYQAVLYEMFKEYVIDVRVFHYYDQNTQQVTQNNAAIVTLGYIIVFIPMLGTTYSQIYDYFSNSVQSFFVRNLPAIPVLNQLSQSSGAFMLVEATPVTVIVRYNIISSDHNIVQNLFLTYLQGFAGKLIEKLDPRDWLTYLTKLAQVERVLNFEVSVLDEINTSSNTSTGPNITPPNQTQNYTIIFALGWSSNEGGTWRLLDINGFRRERNPDNNTARQYFKYISRIEAYRSEFGWVD